jgi:4-alpha-glucanotransferase
MGDLPFVANTHAAEVWARAGEYLLDVSIGVPPDAFSENGQEWGLPMYDWEAIRQSDYAWLRHRARRMVALFDGLRVDHVIGLYRTYGRRPGTEPFFSPPEQAAQIAQGERILAILQESGLEIVAEDLGLVPDFLPPSLARLGVAGCRVLRWERAWKLDGHPFVDPETYPEISAAMTGTHDTETTAVWWDEATLEDRRALLALPLFAGLGLRDPSAAWSPDVRDAILQLLYGSQSSEIFLPFQDAFGWRDRINTPGTVGPENWSWALPWPVDTLHSVPEARERAAFLRELAGRTRRGGGAVD